MTPLFQKKRTLIFWLFIGLFVLSIPPLFLYSTGYRFNKNQIVPTGGLYVPHTSVHGTLSVDGQPVTTQFLFGRDYFVQSMSPGNHSLSFSRDGYSTWQKKIVIYDGLVTEVSPFIVVNPLVTTDITKTIADPEHTGKKISNPLFATVNTLFDPTNASSTTALLVEPHKTEDDKIKKDFISSRKMALWQQNNTLFAEWLGEADYEPQYFCANNTHTSCHTIIPIVKSNEPIVHFDFYPGRNDVVIVTLSDGIYAMEIDPRGEQNSVLLVPGKYDFRLFNETTLYIKKDTKTFLTATLE